jgi:hypothetical protein
MGNKRAPGASALAEKVWGVQLRKSPHKAQAATSPGVSLEVPHATPSADSMVAGGAAF